MPKKIDDPITFCNFNVVNKLFHNSCEIIYDKTMHYFKYEIYQPMFIKICNYIFKSDWESCVFNPYKYMDKYYEVFNKKGNPDWYSGYANFFTLGDTKKDHKKFYFIKYSKKGTFCPDLDKDYLKNFDNIDKIYYHLDRERDHDPYIFICQMKNGVYVSFEACCEYPDFKNQPYGIVKYSNDWITFCENCSIYNQKELITKFYNKHILFIK